MKINKKTILGLGAITIILGSGAFFAPKARAQDDSSTASFVQMLADKLGIGQDKVNDAITSVQNDPEVS